MITVSFMPVFSLEAQEGRLFKPLAFTKTFSMFFAALLGVTLVPVLMTLLIRGKIRPEARNPINRFLIWAYRPLVNFVLRYRWLDAHRGRGHPGDNDHSLPETRLGIHAASERGHDALHADRRTRDVYHRGDQNPANPGSYAAQGSRSDPVFGKAGQAETPTDPAPLSMFETVLPETARAMATWNDLGQANRRDERQHQNTRNGEHLLDADPDADRNVDDRFPEQLGIKIFGPDLGKIQEIGLQIEKALSDLPDTRSVYAERTTGGYFLDFKVQRETAARYGLTVGAVNDVIESAIGGKTISTTVEGRERYPISVRYARDFRDDLDALKRVLVATPSGAQLPISMLADISYKTGPPSIRDENGQLVGFVFVDITTSDLAGYVRRAPKG